MVQIVLIRPGSTEYDQQGRIQGTLDIPLSDEGNAEAQRIGQALREYHITCIYGAPNKSAWQTATLVGDALGLKPKKLDHTENLNHGLWQGMLIDDVRHRQPRVYRQWQEQPDIICPPEGEMLSTARDRVRAVIDRLLKKHREGTIAVVLPEPLACLAHQYLALGELGDLWECGKAHGSWEVIEVDPEFPAKRAAEANGKKSPSRTASFADSITLESST